jgi:hypothetical protein
MYLQGLHIHHFQQDGIYLRRVCDALQDISLDVGAIESGRAFVCMSVCIS